MIRIDVEEYCHQCLDFRSDVIPAIKVRSPDSEEYTLTDTLVKCEYRKRCAGIKRYLEQKAKEEVSG